MRNAWPVMLALVLMLIVVAVVGGLLTVAAFYLAEAYGDLG